MTPNRTVSIQATYRQGYPAAFDLYQPGIEDVDTLVPGLSWSGRVIQLQAFLGGNTLNALSLSLVDEEGQEFPLISGVRIGRATSPLDLLPLLGSSAGFHLSQNAVLKVSIDLPQNITPDGYLSIIGFAEETGIQPPPGATPPTSPSAIAFQALMTQNLGVTGNKSWHTLVPNSVAIDDLNFFEGPGDAQATISEGGWYVVGLEVELGWANWQSGTFIELLIVKNFSEVVAVERKEPYMPDPDSTSFAICQCIPLESGCVIDARIAAERDQGFDVTFAKFTAVKVSNL